MGEISEGNDAKLGHLERTADEPRDLSLHRVTIRKIDQVNDSIRLFRLEIHDPKGIKFLPGQWLDVYAPTIPQAGGFTITCSPSKAIPPASTAPVLISSEETKTGEMEANDASSSNSSSDTTRPYPYLELAIQKSPLNPVAAHLWQPTRSILNTPLHVRVGGSFVFPPFSLSISPDSFQGKTALLDKVIFIAGGVGVNPLMSMLSYIAETFPAHAAPAPIRSEVEHAVHGSNSIENDNENERRGRKPKVHFLYSVKDPDPDYPPDGPQPLDSADESHHQSSKKLSQILFLDRISSLFGDDKGDGQVNGTFKLFLTQPTSHPNPPPLKEDPSSACSSSSSTSSSPRLEHELGRKSYPIYKRRISRQDIATVLGSDKDTSAVYICGVPAMTDSFVELLTSPESSGGFGMATDRVLFEKWW